MYEPLLQVTIPTHLVSSIRCERERERAATRRVIIIAEVFNMPQAERNVAAIVQCLVHTGKVTLVALGDYGRETQFDRPPLTLSEAKLAELLQQAEIELDNGAIRATDYLLRTMRTVEFVGVNNAELLQSAFAARARRLASLEKHYAIFDVLVHAMLQEATDFSTAQAPALQGSLYATPPRTPHPGVTQWQQEVAALYASGHSLAQSLAHHTAPQGINDITDIRPLLSMAAPILERLTTLLDTVKAYHLSAQARRVEHLVQKTRHRFGYLPQLVRMAQDLGVSPVPPLARLVALLNTGDVRPEVATRQVTWLREQILQRILGKTINQYGELKLFFESEIRRIIRSGKDHHRLLSSSRPLYDCTRIIERRLLTQMADTAERNESLTATVYAELLNLTSIFGFDTTHLTDVRKMVHFQQEMDTRHGDIQQYTKDLEKLEQKIARAFPKHERLGDIFDIGRLIEDLQCMVIEAISPEAAKRIQQSTITATALLERLRDLGAPVRPEDQEAAAAFDMEFVQPAIAFSQSVVSQPLAMKDGLLAAMQEHETQTAILLCGGSHPQAVVDELAWERGVACSIITPHLERRLPNAHEMDPLVVRSAMESSLWGNVTIIPMGGSLRRFAQQRLAEQASCMGDGRVKPRSLPEEFDFDRAEDARAWIRNVHTQVAMYETINMAIQRFLTEDTRGDAWHECRVCARQLPPLIGATGVFVKRGDAPSFVLRCSKCRDWLCVACAGREGHPLFPGHGRGDGRRAERFVSMLVCNIHGTMLVGLSPGGVRSSSRHSLAEPRQAMPRVLALRYEGHSYYG